MSNTAVGHMAEQAAAEFLVREGYDIVELNWHTRFCEIDIIATKDLCVHFVEVKYRADDAWGSGLEYITKAKLKQMRYAAEQWVKEIGWRGEINLAAVEVCAQDFAIGNFVESVY